MTSPTALRALAAQLEQAGWTSVAVTKRGTIYSISGRDPTGKQYSGASTSFRGAPALIAELIASAAPQEEQD